MLEYQRKGPITLMRRADDGHRVLRSPREGRPDRAASMGPAGPPLARDSRLADRVPVRDPDPGTFDDLWREIRSLLEDVDDEIATGVISFRVHRVRGVVLSELLDSDEFERILRRGDR
jgi:hypothetical protein